MSTHDYSEEEILQLLLEPDTAAAGRLISACEENSALAEAVERLSCLKWLVVSRGTAEVSSDPPTTLLARYAEDPAGLTEAQREGIRLHLAVSERSRNELEAMERFAANLAYLQTRAAAEVRAEGESETNTDWAQKPRFLSRILQLVQSNSAPLAFAAGAALMLLVVRPGNDQSPGGLLGSDRGFSNQSLTIDKDIDEPSLESSGKSLNSLTIDGDSDEISPEGLMISDTGLEGYPPSSLEVEASGENMPGHLLLDEIQDLRSELHRVRPERIVTRRVYLAEASTRTPTASELNGLSSSTGTLENHPRQSQPPSGYNDRAEPPPMHGTQFRVVDQQMETEHRFEVAAIADFIQEIRELDSNQLRSFVEDLVDFEREDLRAVIEKSEDEVLARRIHALIGGPSFDPNEETQVE